MATDHEIDSDTRALIEQLLTRAGMLMEDSSSDALLRSSSTNDLRSKGRRIGQAVQQMHHLLAAAEALLDRKSS